VFARFCRRAAIRHDSKLAHLVPTIGQRALVLTGVFRPASVLSADAIDPQSTAASNRPTTPLAPGHGRAATIGTRPASVELSRVTMPPHIASTAPSLDVVRGATAFARAGRRSRSANSRASVDRLETAARTARVDGTAMDLGDMGGAR
jgi:hypothetical protein